MPILSHLSLPSILGTFLKVSPFLHCEHSLIRKTLSEPDRAESVPERFGNVVSHPVEHNVLWQLGCYGVFRWWWPFLENRPSPNMAEAWLHRIQQTITQCVIWCRVFDTVNGGSEPNTTHGGCDLSEGFLVLFLQQKYNCLTQKLYYLVVLLWLRTLN